MGTAVRSGRKIEFRDVGSRVPEPAETVPPQGGRVLRAQAFDEIGLVRMTLPFSFPSRLPLSLGRRASERSGSGTRLLSMAEILALVSIGRPYLPLPGTVSPGTLQEE